MRKEFQGIGGKLSKVTIAGTHWRQASIFSSFLISDSFVGFHDIIFKSITQTQGRSGEESPFFWAQRKRIRNLALGKRQQLCYSEQRQSLLVPSLGNAECQRAAYDISSEKDT